MAKYRKKPVIVEAVQWFPDKEVPGVVATLPVGSPVTDHMIFPHVVTIHGQITSIVPGDWIITEPDGIHHYPCKPDIFAATYELAE